MSHMHQQQQQRGIFIPQQNTTNTESDYDVSPNGLQYSAFSANSRFQQQPGVTMPLDNDVPSNNVVGQQARFGGFALPSVSGGGAVAADSYRNMTPSQQPSFQMPSKNQAYPSGVYAGGVNSTSNNIIGGNPDLGIPPPQSPHITSNPAYLQQQQQLYPQMQTPNNLFMQEFLKLQSQQQQPQGQPVFGQGFLNAAQLLANIQQMTQTEVKPQQVPSIPQTPSSQQQQQQQLQNPMNNTNFLAIQQLLNLNSNLNQYQTLIDQIEKQNVTAPPTNVPMPMQQTFSVSRVAQISSQPYTLPTQQQQQLNQTLNTSLLPSQSDLMQIRGGQQQQQQQKNIDMQGGDNFSYLIKDQPQPSQQESFSKDLLQYQQLQPNTVSSAKYNPAAYSAYPSTTNYSVAPGGSSAYHKPDDIDSYIQQKSPKLSTNPHTLLMCPSNDISTVVNKRNLEGAGSPRQINWLSTSNNNNPIKEPPLAYLSSYNAPKQQQHTQQQQFNSDGLNSPLRQSTRGLHSLLENHQQNIMNTNLDNSYTRGLNHPQSNSSHNSSSILQEHHMNSQYQQISQQQQHFKQNPQQQYSPVGSASYRYDENVAVNNEVNQSMNFGKSQKINGGGVSSSFNNNASHQHSVALNIDDIPIGGARVKTFEELLEENLRKMGQSEPLNAPFKQQKSQTNILSEDDESKPLAAGGKREFLKRKSQKAPVSIQTKKYNYYVDNFAQESSDGNPAASSTTTTAAIRKQRSASNTVAAAAERTTHLKQEENNIQHHHHYTAMQHHQPTPNKQEHSTNRPVSPMMDSAATDRQNEVNKLSHQKKKRFLTRGSGTAGGKQGHFQNTAPAAQNSNKKGGQQQQQQAAGKKKTGQNPLLSDDEYPNDFNFAAEQDNKSPKPNSSNYNLPSRGVNIHKRNHQDGSSGVGEHVLTRNSIAEFEKLEQECSKTAAPSQNQIPQRPIARNNDPQSRQYQQKQEKAGNQRRKKLFDDSDSNDDDDDDGDALDHHDLDEDAIEVVQAPRNEETKAKTNDLDEAPKSNVVKKFFYKQQQQPLQQETQSKVALKQGQQPQADSVSEHLERALKLKMEQLDKAIETYNQQTEIAQKLKREYESLVQKQRVDFRDFEAKKKREIEEFEKVKAEELEKIKKERKAVEQRQKNLQMVGASNKKEREEIEQLKRELLRVQEESKAKETKNKGQMDRLIKQNEELKLKNKELADELKHVVDQLRSNQSSSNLQKVNTQYQQQQASQLQQPNSRYSFNTNNKSQDQLNQQPKGILKNKTEEIVRPQSSQQQQQQLYYNEQSNNNSRSNIRPNPQHHKDEEEDEVEDAYQNNNDEDHEDEDEHDVPDDDEEEENNEQANFTGKESNTNQPAEARNPAEDEAEEFDMKFPPQYHGKNSSNMKVVEQIIGHDGKIQRVYENGKKEVIFNNGVKREVFPDGYTIVYFNNHDIKQTYPDQKVVYYFAEARTTQTTFSDGLQVFKFANNQIEKHFPDGTKEIIFPDGTIKCIFADGEEESIFPDGTIQRIEKNGVKAIEFANGQKDILFPDGTRIREYPDGRVRKTYPDGTCENTYRQQQ